MIRPFTPILGANLPPVPTYTPACAWTASAIATPWQDLTAALALHGMTAGTLYVNQATADVLAACTNSADRPAPPVTVRIYDGGYPAYANPAGWRPPSRRSLQRHRKPGAKRTVPVPPPTHWVRHLPDGRGILTDGVQAVIITAYEETP